MTRFALPASDVLLLINGQWTAGERRQPVLDKYRLQPVRQLHLASQEQVHAAVASAHQAFAADTLTPFERGALLARTAVLLERDADQLIAALVAEAGFTHSDARGEIQRTIETFKLSAEEARRFVGEMVPMAGAPESRGRIGFTLRVPLGVVAAVTPFNAPLNTVAHKIAPALAAGNAVVLKPSAHTPSTANLIAQALIDAGLPPGLLNVVHGEAQVAQWLIEDSFVRFVAFTGSVEAGKAIAQRAGLRRTQMELGSIAFTLVCRDANLDVALPKIVAAAYRKAGQVCTSIQTLLVQRDCMVEVERRLVEHVSALRYGDPHDPATQVGPVISVAAAERIEHWIDAAIARGARRLVGGPRQGSVIPPALLTNVDPATPVSCREVFGPVMSLLAFDTLDEAIARVNATPYGLATGIFTNQLDVAWRAARRLQVGGVHINNTSSARVDLMPYGGSKDSGFGREGPYHAIREMSEERMVTVSL